MPGRCGFQDGLEELAKEEWGEAVRAKFEVVAVGCLASWWWGHDAGVGEEDVESLFLAKEESSG